MGTNTRCPTVSDLASKYLFVKEVVINKGYKGEITWQSSLCIGTLSESAFLRELAWVVLASGMREKIIRNLFNNISDAFFNWDSAKIIVLNREKCFDHAIKYFNNKSKISAIICAAEMINNLGFERIKEDIYRDPINSMQVFPYIGPVTVYHLAKNIGLPFAKPDRHLIKIARAEGYSDVQIFCRDISALSGDSIPVVDVVLWRYATIERNYLSFFLENK